MKEQVKKICNWKYIPFVVLVLAFFIFTLFLNVRGTADDAYFTQMGKTEPVFEFISDRYNTWTSRVIIEFILVELLKTSDIFCGMFIAILFGAFGFSISKIFINGGLEDDKVRKINWIIILAILTISRDTFFGAGFMATTANYLLPVVLGIWTLYFVKKMILNQKVRKFEYPIYFIFAVIATNMEQMCAVLLVVYFLGFLYTIIKNKKFNLFIIILLIISILGMVNILTCPGNDSREILETETWYPEYENFGLVDKVELGIYAVISACYQNLNIVYVILATIVMINIFKNYKNLILKLISTIPVITGVMFTVFAPITEILFSNLYKFNEVAMASYDPYANTALMLLPYVASLLCLVISTILVFKKNIKSLVLILVLGAGAATRFIMGFSPTVFASGSRTALILYCSFIIAIVILIQKENEKYLDRCLYILLIVALLKDCDTGLSILINGRKNGIF